MRQNTSGINEADPGNFIINVDIGNPSVSTDANGENPQFDGGWSAPTTVQTTSGEIDATPERLLAHEIGHGVTGTLDDGADNMDNVRENENPIIRELGQPERTKY